MTGSSPYNSTDNPNPNGKHPGGSPAFFNSPEEMQAKIDEYFEKCDKGEEVIVVRRGQSVEVNKKIPYTIEGLALALGFVSTQSLLDYSNKDNEFTVIIARAKTKVAQDNVEGGMLGKYEPKITGLNLQANFGYATASKSEITGPEGGPIELTNLERAAKIATIKKIMETRKAKESPEK